MEKKKTLTSSFTFLTSVILFFVPNLLISIYMVLSGCFMEKWMQTVIKTVCALAGAIVFSLFIGKEKKGKINALGNTMLFMTLYNALNGCRALVFKVLYTKTENMFILYSPYIVLIIIEIPLLIYCLYGCVANCSSFKAFGQLLKAPVKLLIWFVLLVVSLGIYQANTIVSTFLDQRLIFDTLMKSFAYDIGITLISSLLVTLVLKMMMKYYEKKECPEYKKLSIVFAAIVALLAVLSSAGDYVANIEKESDKAIRNVLVYMHYGTEQMQLNNLSTANYYFNKARNHYCLYKGYLDNDISSDYYRYDEFDTEAASIYAFGENDLEFAVNHMGRKYQEDLNANMLVLAIYTKQNQAKEGNYDVEGANLYSAYFCAANKVFFSKFPDITALNEKEKAKFAEDLNILADVEPLAESTQYFCDAITTGRMDDSRKMLDLAEKYPDNKELQYICCYYVTEALEDGDKEFRDRCGNAVDRMVELYKNDPNSDEQTMLLINLKAYSYSVSLGDYQKAMQILNNIQTDDASLQLQIDSSKLMLYDKLEDFDALYKYSTEMAGKGSTIPAVYFYASLGSLKNQKYDETVSYYVDLFKLYENNHYRGDELKSWESYAFVLSEYIAIRDSSSWTDFQYNFFEDFTDSQKQKLSESSFAENYLNTMFYTFESDEKNKAIEYADKIIQSDDHFAMVHYLKGCVYYKQQNFPQAISEFTKAEAFNDKVPAIEYGLANAYDGNGQIQEAYNAASRCYDLISHTDHSKDWYGIGIHNTNLMNDLKRMLERGEE